MGSNTHYNLLSKTVKSGFNRKNGEILNMRLPKARTTELIEQEADNELLIYDLQINKAYTLNETSKIVFKACDGENSFDGLKEEHKYTDDLIFLALDELKKNNLLQTDYTSPFAGMSRREVIRKVGIASMIALPVIATLSAPTPAMAASVCVAPNAGGAPGGSPTVTSPTGDVFALKASCASCCYRDFNTVAPNTGTCCNNCGEARCQ